MFTTILGALRRWLAHTRASSDAALYQMVWGGCAAIICVMVGMCVGSFWSWYFVASLLAIPLVPLFIMLARSTWPSVRNRRFRSGNKFMALHELLDQFVADIGLIGNLPLSESEKARLYIAAYEEFHVERKQLRASIK